MHFIRDTKVPLMQLAYMLYGQEVEIPPISYCKMARYLFLDPCHLIFKFTWLIRILISYIEYVIG
jgi:hypothetical protein